MHNRCASPKITQILQKETLPAAYSRLLGRLLVMRTGKTPHWLPRGVAMRTFVHPQPIVLQVIICHDNRQHWALVLRPVTGQIRSQTSASARSSVLAKPLGAAAQSRTESKLQRVLASQKTAIYKWLASQLFLLVGYWTIIKLSLILNNHYFMVSDDQWLNYDCSKLYTIKYPLAKIPLSLNIH